MKLTIHPFLRTLQIHVYSIVSAFLLAVVSASGAEKSPEMPTFPGQPNMNMAFKKLTKARETIGTKPDDTLVHLKLALNELEGSKKFNKGTFRSEAIRYTKQAISHLEKSDAATATHDIEQALDNLIKAGKFAERK